ncbi:oxidoreductase-like domain-containing protein 1 isoform X2 [Scylla paramamosain]|uniref:oxidoreductase-like domain-containing protein 1 isoform X2 n=1 Tax=Scylla paramamosain TaxID=85552 RepID=UPI0030838421
MSSTRAELYAVLEALHIVASLRRSEASAAMSAWCCLRRVTPAHRRSFATPFPVTESITRRKSSKAPPSPDKATSAKSNPGQPNPYEVRNPQCDMQVLPPTTCCGSGCPNCVWVEYAEKLADLYCDGGLEAERTIERDVMDPNLKAYILMEVRLNTRQKK